MRIFNAIVALKAAYEVLIAEAKEPLGHSVDRKTSLMLSQAILLCDFYLSEYNYRLALKTLLDVGEKSLLHIESDRLSLAVDEAYANAWEIQGKIGRVGA